MKGSNFIVIGAAKCGTTTLCDQLSGHPDIFVSSPKEPKFFSLDENYEQGYESYFKLFENAGSAKARGEGSVNYTLRDHHPETAARIHAFNPEMKLIYVVRHPIERLISHWRMTRLSDITQKDLPGSVNDPNLNKALVHGSRYQYQLDAYLEYFDESQIKVVFLEDMASDPCKVLKECFDYLGVDANWEVERPNRVSNKTNSSGLRSSLALAIKRMPGMSVIKKMVPRKVIIFCKDELGLWPASPVAEVDVEYRDQLTRELKSETLDFLKKHGKADSYWQGFE